LSCPPRHATRHRLRARFVLPDALLAPPRAPCPQIAAEEQQHKHGGGGGGAEGNPAAAVPPAMMMAGAARGGAAWMG
jgi:hypothetical protein